MFRIPEKVTQNEETRQERRSRLSPSLQQHREGTTTNLREQILRSEPLVKQLAEGISHRTVDFRQAELEILKHVNRIGQILVDDLTEGIEDPVKENRVVVAGEVAVFDGVRNLRFMNRFRGQTVKRRRCY
jgi:hypothetical protein